MRFTRCLLIALFFVIPLNSIFAVDINIPDEDWIDHYELIEESNLADYNGTQFELIAPDSFTGSFDCNDPVIYNFESIPPVSDTNILFDIQSLSEKLNNSTPLPNLTTHSANNPTPIKRLVPYLYPTIQAAINDSVDGDVVIVSPGIYYENIDFLGKNITVTSQDPQNYSIIQATVIDAGGAGSTVTFANNETADAILQGFTITGGAGTLYNLEGENYYWGGGVFCYQAGPTIRYNIFTENHCPKYLTGDDIPGVAGAIGCIESQPKIICNTINNNSAYIVGGVITYFGNAIISNNLVHNNSAEMVGGIYMIGGGLLNNNTITKNGASDMGNALVYSFAELGNCRVINNLISSANSGGGLLFETDSPDDDLVAYNNVWGNIGGDYLGINDLTGINGNISVDPLLSAPDVNDFHLTPDSPCINAGDPSYLPGLNEVDIDFEPRIKDIIDIGADELGGNIRPRADAGEDQSFDQLPGMISLDGTASVDFNGLELIYYWRQIEGPPVILTDSNSADPNFIPTEPGIYIFELTVSNGTLSSLPDTVSIIAGNTNTQPPVAIAGAPRYAGYAPITLDGSASYDPDEYTQLIYHWRQISGRTLQINNPNIAKPIVSGFYQTGSIQFAELELVVSDGQMQSEPDVVFITIVPAFGLNTMFIANPPFDPEKPTFLAFSGGNCKQGGGMTFGGEWFENANWLTVENYNKPYEPYGDMLMVYLSSVAPDYAQPIQTTGFSTGNMPAILSAIRVNTLYADPRYNVNRVSLLAPACKKKIDYFAVIPQFLASRVDGEQCWLDNYSEKNSYSFIPNVLNIQFKKPIADHGTPVNWYANSPYTFAWPNNDIYANGVTAGYYCSVAGPAKNLQLPSNSARYYFKWVDSEPDYLLPYSSYYNGRIPEAITLIGPDDGDAIGPNGNLLTCQVSRNVIGYQLLFGSDPHRVQGYEIISDTPQPPSQIITELPFEETWWTVRAYDQYGSTIYADPRLITPPPNNKPIANAGPDKIVEGLCNTLSGTTVTLNGTDSNDPDGDPLAYTWTGPFVESPATGPSPTITLIDGCPGDYKIRLVVNDGKDNSASDYVMIKVIDTTPPDITCPADVSLSTSFNGAVVNFSPTAADDCDPNVIVTTDLPSGAFFNIGVTTVTALATDASGNSSSCSFDVIVSCFGLNFVKIKDKTDPMKDDLEIKGSFKPGAPIDLSTDSVIYIFSDANGNTIGLDIPAGSFEIVNQNNDGNDNINNYYKYDSPSHSIPDMKGNFYFDKCQFDFNIYKYPILYQLTGTELTVEVHVGRNIVKEKISLTVIDHGVKLQYLAKPKLYCCPHPDDNYNESGFSYLSRLANKWLWLGDPTQNPDDITKDGTINFLDLALLRDSNSD